MKKSEFIYLLAILILDFISLADVSRIINIDGGIRNIIYMFTIVLFIFKIFQSRYEKKKFIFILITGLIALFVSYRLSDFMFLTDFLVMISIVDVNINKAIKIDIFVKSLFLIIHSIFYFHDFLFAYTKIEPYFVLTKAFGIRHSLYFSHPNTAAAIVVWLVIDWIYIAKNKRIPIALGSLLVAFYSYFTISRTALIVYILFLLILFLLNKKRLKKIFNFLEKYLFIIMAGVNILMISISSLMNNPLINSLDKILSKRLYYTNLAINTYGFHILPNNISDSIMKNSIIVDNFYTRAFISYGFIILIIVAIMYYLSTKKENSNLDKVILIIFPVYLFNELFPFNVGRAIPLLIFANIIFNKNKLEKQEK
ncbi:MAG: hypothetical protein HFI49_01640 [Bacilli bacterium]|jgi:hypothetical protein|nr:hypothetical protein [Bacilli bacterium]